MKQIIAIGGEPATGKTTLMNLLISRLGGNQSFKKFSYGRLKGMFSVKENILIFGLYDGQMFSGTDRLSMAVMPDAVKFMESEHIGNEFKDTVMIFEGDRLFNVRFLLTCRKVAPTAIMVLETSQETKDQRHIKRGDNQSEGWLRGRKTKIKNILEQVPDVQLFKNETEMELSKNAFSVLALAGRKNSHS